MYPVSNAFLTAVKEKTRKYYWTGRITTKTGVTYSFGPEDIVKGSGTITAQCCGNTEIELGTVYTPRRIIEELTFVKPSKERKVTIVTNFPKAFDYMLSYKGKLSYNGELSIILVDVKRAALHREEYISHYAGEGAPGEMLIV